MSEARFHRRLPEVSAKLANEAIADALVTIKGDLTDAEIGRVLSRSADRVREWRMANAGMSAATFLRGLAEWGAAFGDGPISLTGWRLVPDVPHPASDADKVARLAAVVASLARSTADPLWSDAKLLECAGSIDDLGLIAADLGARLAALRGPK